MSNLEDKAADIKSDAALERAPTEHDGTIFEERELDQDRFSVWSVVGIQYSCSAAPLAICSFTYLVAGVGGSSYFTWCYLVAVVGQLLVTASLAEISAILPHASGRYISIYFHRPIMGSDVLNINSRAGILGGKFGAPKARSVRELLSRGFDLLRMDAWRGWYLCLYW
jgi:hypothetical protein